MCKTSEKITMGRRLAIVLVALTMLMTMTASPLAACEKPDSGKADHGRAKTANERPEWGRHHEDPPVTPEVVVETVVEPVVATYVL
jgi:hypothetical protein